MATNHFPELYGLDLTGKVEELTKKWTDKSGEEKSFTLHYLHWTAAVKELRERFPDAKWTIREFDGGLPYKMVNKGAMVHVSVTINGDERGCWLPVMNQKHEVIEDPDAFDINTAHWRCFVKACALHGLGLTLYEKDDRPADKGATKYELMPHGEKGSAVNIAVTVLSARDLAGKGKKLDCLNEQNQLVKVTIWNRKGITAPGQGEQVIVSGIWEVDDKYGASIVADKVASAGEGPKTEPEPKEIPDSPENRAKVLKRYQALTEKATLLGVPFTYPTELKDKSVKGLTEAGLQLNAAIEKAEIEAAATGSQVPMTNGKGAAPQEWPI